MQVIPLEAVPRQSLQVQLAGQPITLTVYQLAYGLFVDVYLADALVLGGVIAENLNRIVRSAYLGIVGDFIFVDQGGTSDPVYTGLGDRFQLCYLTQAEVEAGTV